MAATTPDRKDAEKPRERASMTSRWLRLTLILVGLLALAFGISALVSSQAVVGSANKRNAHNLAVIGNALESWPRTIAEIAAARRAGGADYAFDHPALGRVLIGYVPCTPEQAGSGSVPATRFDRGSRPGEGSVIEVAGRTDGEAADARCYRARLPLTPILSVDQTIPAFSNLLIVGPDAAVVEQFGSMPLPVTKLGALSSARTVARDIASNLTGASPPGAAAEQAALDSAPGAATVRIADVEYFAYLRTLRLEGRSCAPAAGKGCAYYLVGLMPAGELRRASLMPRPLVLIGFGLALLIVIALLPVARLLLIGSTEAVSQFEVGAMVFGLFAASGIATLAWLYAFEVAGERQVTATEGRALAAQIAGDASTEFNRRLRQALACQWGDGRGVAGGAKPIPDIIETGFVNAQGGFAREARKDCARRQLPPNADIGKRYYFRQLQWPGTACIGDQRYAVGQVRAQTDGLDKTVVVAAPGCTGRPGGDVFLFTTILQSLIAPMLPPPHQFMVVDTADEALPVRFHGLAGRAGFEDLTSEIGAPGKIVSALREIQAQGAAAQPISFVRRYDGRVTRFAAAPIVGTPWVLLVYHPVDTVDRIASGTVLRALTGWAAFSVCALAVCALLLFASRSAWHAMWPFADGVTVYRKSVAPLLVTAIVIVLIGFAGWSIGPPLAVALAAAACVAVYVALRRRRLDATPMRTREERAYFHFVLALLACVAVAPMIAFWSDARSYSREIVDRGRFDGARAMVRQNWMARASLAMAIGPPETGAPAPASVVPAIIPRSGMAQGKAEAVAPASFSHAVAEYQGDLVFPTIPVCRFEGEIRWYCWYRPSTRPSETAVAVTPRDAGLPRSAVALFGLLLLAGALFGLIVSLLRHGLESLTGFGIPLGAVTWPTLVLFGDASDPARNELSLTTKSLLVAPQQAVRDWIARDARSQGRGAPPDTLVARPIDLADVLLPAAQGTAASALPAWDPEKGSPYRLVVTGLELVLRDSALRRAALGYLERAARIVSEAADPDKAQMVVIAEMSPLERILDAFDIVEKEDDLRVSTREELRWARLFQDFTTFSFEPIDKLGDYALPDTLDRDDVQPVQRLVEETRWLPGTAIDSVIGDPSSRRGLVSRDGRFPIPAADYQAHYRPRILTWAQRMKPISDEAAVDFLRASLIEFYEQCWESSSFAERVVLDAIAHGSYVNMCKAVALQSLVRRGLVIIDPVPRPMNESFAAFIRQTERPGTLLAWRQKQPRSTWSAARLPLVIVIPLSVLGLMAAAASSGLELTAVLPLMAAAIPAAIGAVARGMRGS